MTVAVPGVRALFALAALLAVIAGCGGDGEGGSAVDATLAPGDTHRSTDPAAEVTFRGVENDSRCATDVTCVRAGEALVLLLLRTPDGDHNLRITVPRGSGAGETVHGLTVTVVDLQPLPLSTRPTAPSEYRIRVRVTR